MLKKKHKSFQSAASRHLAPGLALLARPQSTLALVSGHYKLYCNDHLGRGARAFAQSWAVSCIPCNTSVGLLQLARAAQRAFVKRGLAAEKEADWVTPDEVFTAVRKAAARAKRKAKM